MKEVFMSCYHPLKGIDFGLGPNGKHIIKILPESYNLQQSLSPDAKIISIPCGQCIGCRLDYSRQWADRCMLEAMEHKSNWFITLTYDNEHLPVFCNDDGEVLSHPLCKRDVQLFMKRLRKNTGQKIRYYGCGEYGSSINTMRPHYHLILFGLELDDLVINYKDSNRGFIYYNSPTIDRAWQSRGFHLITKVTWDTCAYTARYIMKKQKGNNSDIYDKLNLVPEFSVMSRRPGIGQQYYEKHKDHIYEFDSISFPLEDRGHTIRPPRYYDKLYDIEDHENMLIIKNYRQRTVENSTFSKIKSTSLDYKDMLLSEEEHKKAQIKILKRKEF